jgi:hypothetical protein
VYQFVRIRLERLLNRFKRIDDGAFALLRRCQVRLAAVSGGLQKARRNGIPTSISVRSPPYEARASSNLVHAKATC